MNRCRCRTRTTLLMLFLGLLATGAARAAPSPATPQETAGWDIAANESKDRTATTEGHIKGVEKGLKDSQGFADVAAKALEFNEALTSTDKAMHPNYSPPGAPQVPSKCMENKKCRPCFERAQSSINTSRKNLEKVLAIYSYTHKFTKAGQALLTSMGGTGGAIAAMGAAVESRKVDKSLEAFDSTVREKNKELLAKLETNLRELGRCEAEFYKNEDWFARYGFIYYQFMLARYSY